jgi:hypothetical protein
MSIFGKIMDKLGLGRDESPAATQPRAQATAKPGSTVTQAPRSATPAGQQQAQMSPQATPRSATPPPTQAQRSAQPTPMSNVDVEATLERLASQHDQKLNWRTSIVDLMKLLGMESSLAERKELAQELGFPQDQMNDSAKMNVWLHKEVLRRLAQNGGKVPKDLLD